MNTEYHKSAANAMEAGITPSLLDALRKLVEAIDDYAPANFPKDVVSAFNEANDLLAQFSGEKV